MDRAFSRMRMSATPVNQARVLVVDDDPMDLLLLEEALRTSVWVSGVEVARGPGEALAVLKRRTPVSRNPVDLVISDLHMPEGGGRAVIDAIRGSRFLRRLPIVVFSDDT